DRPAAVAGMGGRHEAGGDGGGRPAARAARAAADIPWVAGGAVGHRLGRGEQAELRGVGPAEEDEPGRPEAGGEIGVVIFSPSQLLQEPHAAVMGIAGGVAPEVFDEKWHPLKRPGWWRMRVLD